MVETNEGAPNQDATAWRGDGQQKISRQWKNEEKLSDGYDDEAF